VIKSKFCLSRLPLTLNGDAALPADTLDAFFSLEGLRQQVRQRAADILRDARNQRHTQRARDRRLFAHRQRRQRLCAKRVYLRAREQGLKASLQWLVDEQQWAQDVARHLMQKTCEQIAVHLQAQIPSLPWENVLQQQLPTLMEEMASGQRLILRLAPTLIEKAQKSLTDLPLIYAPLPEGEEGFAWLENGTARVAIPLTAQLDDLFYQLENLEWHGGDHGGY